MKGVTVIRKCALDLDARDWCLYRDMENADKVASELNGTIEQAVRAGKNFSDTYIAADACMKKFAAFGAADTEPYQVLFRILREVFDNVKGGVVR